MPNPVTLCLWYNKDAEAAARFYAETFPDSAVGAVHYAPGDYPDGKKGDALTVEFTVLGIPCIGLNGGPQFPHSEAFSFQIATATQEETDRYWDAFVVNGGAEDLQTGLFGEQPLHRLAIELAIGLGARTAHRRTLGLVQHAELDAAAINRPRHDAVERIDLAHQMTLAQPADRRVAGHLADLGRIMGDEQRPRPHPGRRRRRLGAGMAAADHDHVKARCAHCIT